MVSAIAVSPFVPRRGAALVVLSLGLTVSVVACSDASDGSATDEDNLNGPDPSGEYCDQVADWDPDLEAWEFEVLEITNQRRSEGANCGSGGSFGPAGPLSMQTQLRCAARAHSLDMVERNFFDHTNPDGEGPQVRIDAAGYQWTAWGENIAGGYPDPEAVVAGWMSSDGHCSNIMSPDFEELGVGAYTDEAGTPVWTQVFGRP
jgi:uncharacterized protein YkwD